MSKGIKPYDFVQQVYYAQEKVVLDFWPTDDKYKEVLFEANLLLQELQSQEDWNWLRERIVLGDTHHKPNEIPEYKLPDWVYKHSTLYDDTIKLYRKMPPHHHCNGYCQCGEYDGMKFNMRDFIEVPFASVGDNQHRKDKLMTERGVIHVWDPKLRAVRIGDIITFNRMFVPFEECRVAVMDVQRQIKQFHICNDFCKGVDPEQSISYELDEHGNFINPCAKIEPVMLTEIPDPNYVVIATAARHAEGSPPAAARVQSLNDQAQRILSAMRQNDAAATDADYAEWDIPGYVQIV